MYRLDVRGLLYRSRRLKKKKKGRLSFTQAQYRKWHWQIKKLILRHMENLLIGNHAQAHVSSIKPKYSCVCTHRLFSSQPHLGQHLCCASWYETLYSYHTSEIIKCFKLSDSDLQCSNASQFMWIVKATINYLGCPLKAWAAHLYDVYLGLDRF